MSDIRYSPDLTAVARDKSYYALTMFPYPSGSWLHCGHASVFTINDVIARYKRMQWYSVLNPFGFDAFGLPTENYAIKQWKPAREVTDINKQKFLEQVKALNMSFDMNRVIDTSEPEYYKWTQWIFAKLYDAWLVYRDTLRVNRCPECKTVLANDQVVLGKCERCKDEITQKKHPQWFIKITAYADRLIEDLDLIDRPQETKIAQKNWIWRKTGINITYSVTDHSDLNITCFTTRPDTNFGATFVVLAPEADFVAENIDIFPNKDVCSVYVKEALAKTTVQRMKWAKKKTWCFTWLYVTNELNNKQLPVYIGDFVLADVGTWAVVWVPGHDVRDFEFAQALGIDITRVVVWPDEDTSPITHVDQVQEKSWYIINSWFLDGMEIMKAKDAIMDYLEEQWRWKKIVNYKLRDRSVSRQRYWGSPIPMYFDEQGAVHRVPDEELPVILPLDLKTYKPKGKSPLEDHDTFPRYEKTVKALLIHWRWNSSHDAWVLHGVERFLQQQWVEVIFPDFSFADDADFDKVMHDIWVHNVDLIVWHSSGWYLALHAASNGNIDNVVLISPVCESHLYDENLDQKVLQYDIDFVKKIENRLGKENTMKYLAFHDYDIDYSILKDKNIKVFFGDQDDILNVSITWYFEDWNSTLLEWRWHMWSDEWVDNVDEINDYLKKIVSSINKKRIIYRRECDTLDTFMCSSFYFLRFPDADNNDELIRRELANKMFPVDFYSWGKEHTVGHLLYSRFIHKFLYDQWYVDSPEPFAKLVHQWMVLGADGRKMGKRYGNGVDPIEVVQTYGADAVRMYMMFMWPVEADKQRNDGALKWVKKFLDRVERLLDMERMGKENQAITSLLHQTIQGITHDIEHLKLNTVVSKYMILVNAVYEHKAITEEQLKILALLLAPYATQLAEKIRTTLWWQGDIHDPIQTIWPQADTSKILQSRVTLPVQVNWKIRAKIDIEVWLSEEDVLAIAIQQENIIKHVENKPYRKVIWVQDKILNIIV